MAGLNHRFINTNGIRMHIAEEGTGPLVILCHGFPGCWYSWRHQLPALAGAGFHVVTPDQRGYGQTDRPEAIEAYDMFQLTGDIVGLVDALGQEQVIIVGHDWKNWQLGLSLELSVFSIAFAPFYQLSSNFI
jgi:pimeloyl-ACP methyl ester carboxylesterase